MVFVDDVFWGEFVWVVSFVCVVLIGIDEVLFVVMVVEIMNVWWELIWMILMWLVLWLLLMMLGVVLVVGVVVIVSLWLLCKLGEVIVICSLDDFVVVEMFVFFEVCGLVGMINLFMFWLKLVLDGLCNFIGNVGY